MILIIDNYDSFTYNLVQYIGAINPDLEVFRNDKVSLEQIGKINPDRIVISPGPGRPEDAGLSIEIINKFGSQLPIFGICLGHQAITVAFGGKVGRAKEIVHGKTSMINHSKSVLFTGLPEKFEATRYHSLVALRDSFPPDLKITAQTDNGLIMGLEHKKFPIYGVQFHPESILTEYGMEMIKNFLMV
jgi:anthranilate synthase/aminodeoxychorismate synthase-like glutamine amidotransferase